MSACQSRSGIFTLKMCGETAAASCAECGKPVCFKHYRLYQGTPYCVECYVSKDAGAAGDSDTSDMELERARRRQDMESTTPGMVYGDYDETDYETFDTTGAGGLPDDDALSPDSFQDS